MTAKRTPSAKTTRSAKPHPAAPAHPRAFPFVASEPDADLMPDQPFEEGVGEVIDPDLRYRMISETAYNRYAERGYEDGYDVDDWLDAEAEVDHLLLGRAGGAA